MRPGSGDHVGTQTDWYLQTGLWVWEGEGRGFGRKKKTGATPWKQSQLARWHRLPHSAPPNVRLCLCFGVS